MNYQVEIFKEIDEEDLQESLNNFLMLLPSERIKDIYFNQKTILLPNGEIKIFYYAIVIYTYFEK